MPTQDVAALPCGPVADIAGQWWVAQTRPRFENRLARDLQASGIAFYLPTEEIYVYEAAGKKRRRETRIAFPSYVFVCGTDEHRYQAACSIATIRTIPICNQARFRRELAAVQEMYRQSPTTRAVAALRTGQRVEVLAGPMMGHAGTIERMDSTHVYFSISILGRAVPLEIPAEFIGTLDN